METTITIIKENAPFAVMLLLAVLYLESDMDQLRADMDRGHAAIRSDMDRKFSDIDQQFTGVRSDIAGLGERMARVESKIGGMDGRLSRIEGLLDDMRPLNISTPEVPP